MEKARGFSLKKAIVAEGGWLTEPWVMETKVIDGKEFFALHKADRKFARAMGMDIKQRAPFGSCSLFEYLCRRRDKEVDKLIMQGKADDDPMGDEGPNTSAPVAMKGREKSLQSGKIPSFVGIDLPNFVMADGERVAAHSMNIVTTPRRWAVVSAEATGENLDWILKAMTIDWHSVDKRTSDDVTGLPELTQPGVKYRRCGEGSVTVYINYRTAEIGRAHV